MKRELIPVEIVAKIGFLPRKTFNQVFMRPVLAPISSIGQTRFSLILGTEATLKMNTVIHAWHTGRLPGSNLRILP